jgi:hypothetical protein
MKKLILISIIVFISFANIFAQEVLKTNLRVRYYGKVELPEQLNCEFTISQKCDFIVWNNTDHNLINVIPLLSFVESFDFHIWKIDTYKTNYDDIVKIHYEDDKIYGIRFIDSSGVETLYIVSNNTDNYPQASK